MSQWRVVYALRDPRDDKIYYVGETKDAYGRVLNHMAEALSPRRSGGGDEKDAWLRDLILSGNLPIVELLENSDSRKGSRAAEDRWILRFKEEGHPLFNKVPYFRTPEGREMIYTRAHNPKSEETKEKMRQARKDWWVRKRAQDA